MTVFQVTWWINFTRILYCSRIKDISKGMVSYPESNSSSSLSTITSSPSSSDSWRIKALNFFTVKWVRFLSSHYPYFQRRSGYFWTLQKNSEEVPIISKRCRRFPKTSGYFQRSLMISYGRHWLKFHKPHVHVVLMCPTAQLFDLKTPLLVKLGCFWSQQRILLFHCQSLKEDSPGKPEMEQTPSDIDNEDNPQPNPTSNA